EAGKHGLLVGQQRGQALARLGPVLAHRSLGRVVAFDRLQVAAVFNGLDEGVDGAGCGHGGLLVVGERGGENRLTGGNSRPPVGLSMRFTTAISAPWRGRRNGARRRKERSLRRRCASSEKRVSRPSRWTTSLRPRASPKARSTITSQARRRCSRRRSN